ncbi:MAG TPA: AsmA family protein, partial [bacterium]|nr:AsmA family protein [bacterium]
MFRSKIWLTIGIACGALAVAFVSLAFYVSHRLRDVKGPLIRALQSQIDGELKVGEAKVVMFPAGLDLKDIQLYAPGEQEPSAKIEVAELRFNLIPLVRKKIEGKLNVVKPEIFLRRPKDGNTNMERIFAPLISGESKERVSAVDQLWWKRLAIDRLRIRDARFLATREGSEDKVELKDIDVSADRIRFDGSRDPAKIKISYSLPQVSKEPMEITTRMRFDEAIQGLRLEDGALLWGETKMDFSGP